MSRSQIQYGSQGNDVKELQTLLNKNGSKLIVDGIFGAETQKAVKAYQQKYGLTVDGIVGVNTWGKLLGGSSGSTTTTPTTPTAPKVEPLPTNPTYDSTKWGDTEQGKAALDAYNTAKDAVANHGDFKYGNQQQLDALINSILNRDKFSYDLNGDALYQQYKDKYIQQGKLAMGDAIGQASAMTGGYGNSYAQSVGQQAYQGQLDKLNDIVPQLYQMALDKYNAEGQEMYNQYGLLTDDYNREYGMYQDKYGRLMDALGIARGDYYDGANMFHTEQSNKNNIASKEFEDAMSIWNANNTNAWNEAQWNRDQTWRDEDIKREQDRWAVEDAQWQKQFDAVYGNKPIVEDTNNGGYTGGNTGGNKVNTPNSKTPVQYEKPDNGGNKTENNVSQPTTEVPDAIKQKAATFTSNDALDAYLTQQYKAGNITYEQMGKLYLEYEVPSLSSRNWTVVKNGGINWLGGIDNNATVKDQYGNTYRLDKLVDALVAEGMDKSAAKAYVKKLQGQLGI